MKTLPFLSITFYLFLCAPVPAKAQLSGLARILSMESRAATGLRSAEYLSNFSRSSAGASEILGATRNSSVYGNHLLELERSIGGSIYDRSKISEPNWSSIANNHPDLDRFFVNPNLGSDRYRMANITELNELEMEPYLKQKYEIIIGLIKANSGKSRLSHLDSLQAYQMLYMISSNAIRSSAFSKTNASGGGRWGGNYPPTIDYSLFDHNRSNEPSEEERDDDNDDDDDEDDNDNDDNNDDQDSDRDSTQNDSTGHSRYNKLETKPAPAAKFPFDPMGIMLMVVLYWLFSTIGLFKMSQHAGLHAEIALVPFVRLGLLFQLAGYQPWKAWLLLVPGVNIYYWINVNLKLCKSNLFSAYWAILGVFIPGLFWLVLGQTRLESK